MAAGAQIVVGTLVFRWLAPRRLPGDVAIPPRSLGVRVRLMTIPQVAALAARSVPDAGAERAHAAAGGATAPLPQR